MRRFCSRPASVLLSAHRIELAVARGREVLRPGSCCLIMNCTTLFARAVDRYQLFLNSRRLDRLVVGVAGDDEAAILELA